MSFQVWNEVHLPFQFLLGCNWRCVQIMRAAFLYFTYFFPFPSNISCPFICPSCSPVTLPLQSAPPPSTLQPEAQMSPAPPSDQVKEAEAPCQRTVEVAIPHVGTFVIESEEGGYDDEVAAAPSQPLFCLFLLTDIKGCLICLFTWLSMILSCTLFCWLIQDLASGWKRALTLTLVALSAKPSHEKSLLQSIYILALWQEAVCLSRNVFMLLSSAFMSWKSYSIRGC